MPGLHDKSRCICIALFVKHISLQCYVGCQKLAFMQFHIKNHHVYYFKLYPSVTAECSQLYLLDFKMIYNELIGCSSSFETEEK